MSEPKLDGTDIERVFKDTMASLASGVAVVTGLDPDGTPRGLTVTSIASYSGDPPSVLVSIDRTSGSYRALTEGSHFAVNLLGADQSDLADLFASKVADKFDRCAHTGWGDGTPVLDGALATLVCRRSFIAEHGDHAIVIGNAVEGAVNGDAPLVYWRRGYYDRLSRSDAPSA